MPIAALAAERYVVAARPSRSHAIAQLLSLAPFWILLAVAADPQIRLLGFQADALLSTVTLIWMAVGTLIIRFGRSPLAEAIGLLLFTIPATTAAVLAPALLFALGRAG